MLDKIKAAEEFLKSLEEPSVTMDMMLDRIDVHMLYVIHNYAELISKVKNRTNIEEKDIITCAMIIGYLLKTHLDRYELEQSMQTNNIN
ncbi:MAG: hypothetical protein PHC34_12900 [Candidatus Gastranaerophilales bacterium]|nr:hypothetical protein [Candidatus Gastranaerophilales bacterium]